MAFRLPWSLTCQQYNDARTLLKPARPLAPRRQVALYVSHSENLLLQTICKGKSKASSASSLRNQWCLSPHREQLKTTWVQFLVLAAAPPAHSQVWVHSLEWD